MSLLSGISDFFGLDIGTTALRVVELKGSGPVKTLQHYGQTALEGTLAISDAKVDRQKVALEIHNLVKKVGITTSNVAVNLPSSRVFTAVVDLNKMPAAELAKTIRYQAQTFIPTPLAQSKIDWAVIGPSPKNASKMEILLSSVSNDLIEPRLDMLEAAGLNVVAFEPDSMALARAMIPADATTPEMVLDVGASSTDLVITLAGTPRLTRAIPIGSQAIIRSAVQSLGVEPAQAEQFVFKFGLGKDKLEGQVYNAIIGTIDSLVNEIEKSIAFFQERYTNMRLDRIIVTGGASALPEFPLYIANKFGLNVEIGNAWRNVSFPSARQNELLSVSNHFAVAVGLAERTGP
ncbi:MAG: type IV pilus assembly protein PilM [Candidatus Saccharimonadales bacterium]|jgi:type IV pilus assembly protein PilM